MIEDYTAMSIEQLKHAYIRAKEDKQHYADAEKLAKDEIIRRESNNLAAALRNKTEPFGTVNLNGVKFTVPKKVEWDQVALADLYKEIGETAHEYMDVSYKVREAAFKNWPSAIQESFIPARTVKPGSITIEITEK